MKSPLNIYKKLQPREKLMLLALSLIVIIMAGQQLWLAYEQKKISLLNDTQVAQQQLLWLQDKRIQSHQLRHSGAGNYTIDEIQKIILESAEKNQITLEIKNIEDNIIEIIWEGNTLSAFLVFMSFLNVRGIVIEKVNINKSANNFAANILIVLHST